MRNRLPLRVSLPAIALMAILMWGIIILLVTGCSAVRPGLPGTIVAAKEATMEQALAPPTIKAFRSLLVDEDPHYGITRRLFGRTGCEGSIPAPYIIPAPRVPTVGQEWECLFVTCVCSSPPEPDWPAWIICSTKPPGTGFPVDLTPTGLPGCWLHVNPELLISVPVGFEAPAGSLLTRVKGRGQILLRWTPQPGMGGQHVWMQLMVHAPDHSPGGFLLSHAIEVIVGS